MATVPQIKFDNDQNIRVKTAPGSITKIIDAAMRDVVANELRDRGILILSSTGGLADSSKENTKKILVAEVGIFEPIETADDPDDLNTFASADDGWLWRRIVDLSSVVSADTFEVNEDWQYLVIDGWMIDKILIRPDAADTIKVGTTDGGEEVMPEIELEANKWTSITTDIFTNGADITLYFIGITNITKIKIYKRKL